MLHQVGESGLCHLCIAPYLGIACDLPKEMKCFAMMSDEFDHFLGIVDRRGENVRVPIEEALDLDPVHGRRSHGPLPWYHLHIEVVANEGWSPGVLLATENTHLLRLAQFTK